MQLKTGSLLFQSASMNLTTVCMVFEAASTRFETPSMRGCSCSINENGVSVNGKVNSMNSGECRTSAILVSTEFVIGCDYD
jgi:hypothetical protein